MTERVKDLNGALLELPTRLASAVMPLDGVLVLLEAGQPVGLDAWLLAAEADIWHGYLFSAWPIKGAEIQRHMEELAKAYMNHKPGVRINKLPSGVYAVQTGCLDEREPIEQWTVHRDYLITVADEPVAILRCGSLAGEDSEQMWRAADQITSAASAAIARLLTLGDRASNVLLDPLTGLYGPAFFYDQLRREVRRAAAYAVQLSLMIVKLRSRTGVPISAHALREFARIISANTRRTDIAARIGPHEVAVLMPHTSTRDALNAADRLYNELKQAKVSNGHYTVHIGISGWNIHGPDEEELLRQAAEAAEAAAVNELEGPFVHV